MRSSTAAGTGAQWYDSHLMRWVLGRLRPVGGWEKLDLTFASPIRAMHVWVDQNSVERVGILCERHLYVFEGSDTLRDITPLGYIQGPSNTLTTGGYGNNAYGRNPAMPPVPNPTPPPDTIPAPDVPNLYGTPRDSRPDRRHIGEIWRLANWGEDLLAMASPDGRLLRWKPGPDVTPLP